MARLQLGDVISSVKTWLNTMSIDRTSYNHFSFEDLPENDFGYTFSTRQGAQYLKKYIGGGYLAQYQFYLIVRVLPSTDEDSIDAIELLNKMADWCVTHVPSSMPTAKIERTTDAAVLSVFEDGVKDYNITMNITWEEL